MWKCYAQHVLFFINSLSISPPHIASYYLLLVCCLCHYFFVWFSYTMIIIIIIVIIKFWTSTYMNIREYSESVNVYKQTTKNQIKILLRNSSYSLKFFLLVKIKITQSPKKTKNFIKRMLQTMLHSQYYISRWIVVLNYQK